MHVFKFVNFNLAHKCISDRISQDILSQNFDVIQSNVALQKQVPLCIRVSIDFGFIFFKSYVRFDCIGTCMFTIYYCINARSNFCRI